jgi:hypothetical protein
MPFTARTWAFVTAFFRAELRFPSWSGTGFPFFLAKKASSEPATPVVALRESGQSTLSAADQILYHPSSRPRLNPGTLDMQGGARRLRRRALAAGMPDRNQE